MTDFSGKHVIITGGSQGIGAAIAREAAAHASQVSLIARTEETLRATAESIGKNVDWYACDVTDADTLKMAVEELESRWGPCEILVCCAGLVLPGRFLDVPLAEFDDQWRANVRGTVAAIKIVLPAMVERGAGHVVLVSSTEGIIGIPGYTGYAGTKFAIRGIADSLRYEVEPRGVQVSVLYPPDTQTPGFAAENLRKPLETAAISARIKPFPAQKVAAALIRGVQRNDRNVTVDGTTRIFRRFGGILEPALRWSFQRTVRQVRDSQ